MALERTVFQSFDNLILTANPMRQKYRNYTHGDKKNWMRTPILLVVAFLLLRKERKLFDEKIKAFLTALSSIVATCGCRALEMWLILIEMYCKFYIYIYVKYSICFILYISFIYSLKYIIYINITHTRFGRQHEILITHWNDFILDRLGQIKC